MYQQHFGLKEQAFSIAVNPRYLYMSEQHREALAHLLYGVTGGGFVMLTGEVGTGKTTIIRCLLEQLPENTEIAIVLNPMSNVLEMLRVICDEFNIKYPSSTSSVKALTDILHNYLLNNYQQGKNTVLLIDEAQLLATQVLEQVRLLTNLETSTQKLLQIVLVGQPELNTLMSQKSLRQLSQRITARFHLNPLTLGETRLYIDHRLSVAGLAKSHSPFPAKIVKKIHTFTGGIPRVINILCERMLTGAYGKNRRETDIEIFDLAKREVKGNRQSHFVAQTIDRKWWLAGGMFAFLSFVVTTALLLSVLFRSTPNTPLAQENQPPQQNQTSGLILRQSASSTPQVQQSDNGLYLKDLPAAQALLFGHLKVPTNLDSPPCWQANASGYQCETTNFDTWQDITTLNRPVILHLITPEKFPAHALLIGIQGEYAQIITSDRKQQVVTLDSLGPLWTGKLFYVWRKPKDFVEALRIGSRHPTVTEVAENFRLLDAQATPLSTGRFNRALQERIKTFQKESGLDTDGILGARTLMKLNEQLGISTQLNTKFL
ncbi:MAG: general secretion pathway protein GspA [Alteromonadaceae bacterium]|nr:MAG: general secretion pathway protein GspA [Alteromonadaceae bacterium]